MFDRADTAISHRESQYEQTNDALRAVVKALDEAVVSLTQFSEINAALADELESEHCTDLAAAKRRTAQLEASIAQVITSHLHPPSSVQASGLVTECSKPLLQELGFDQDMFASINDTAMITATQIQVNSNSDQSIHTDGRQDAPGLNTSFEIIRSDPRTPTAQIQRRDSIAVVDETPGPLFKAPDTSPYARVRVLCHTMWTLLSKHSRCDAGNRKHRFLGHAIGIHHKASTGKGI
jgi:hypothetical protein